MAESQYLNQILINILSTATSPRISIKNKNKTKQKEAEEAGHVEIYFKRAGGRPRSKIS